VFLHEDGRNITSEICLENYIKIKCSSVVFLWIISRNSLTGTTRWGYLNFWAVSRLPWEGCFCKYISGIPRTFVTMNVKIWRFWTLRALYLQIVVFSRLYLSLDWRNFPKKFISDTAHTFSRKSVILLRVRNNWAHLTWRAKRLFRLYRPTLKGISGKFIFCSQPKFATNEVNVR